MFDMQPSQPLARLLLGYAPRDARARHRLCWLLDERLAGVLRTVRDPSLAAIRMAWWRDALVNGDLSKGRGEPLIEAWRASGLTAHDAAAIDAMIDGWSALIGDTPLSDDLLIAYAQARGGGLFDLLAGPDTAVSAPARRAAGSLWALWDLAGHISSAEAAAQSLRLAHRYQAEAVFDRTPQARVLRLATRVAAADMARTTPGPIRFGLRHYLTIWRDTLSL